MQQKKHIEEYFGRRISTQSRHILDDWQSLKDSDWAPLLREQLLNSTKKLYRYARRFEAIEHERQAERLLLVLEALADHSPCDTELGLINEQVYALCHTSLRRDDQNMDEVDRSKKPVYIALNNAQEAHQLIEQLGHFQISAYCFSQSDELSAAIDKISPLAVVIDIDFQAPLSGLDFISETQQNLEHKLPVIFFSQAAPGIETRLKAVRANGIEFLSQVLDPNLITGRLDKLIHTKQESPFRVLVVEDSKTQAFVTRNILDQAGMPNEGVTNPFELMQALQNFKPEIIMMDLYMPHCTGIELARVIRQQEEYLSTPIIFLSAENNLNTQLAAMAEGGDDFLTKPISANQLIATIENRGRRSRFLREKMLCDSLTGLYTHTHTLHLLDQCMEELKTSDEHLAFVMIDIDLFKQVNDVHGHPTGDQVIRSLSQLLKQRLRKSDIIGRYGGEEFAVILRDIDQTSCLNIVDSLREHFALMQHSSPEGKMNCTFSAGICMFDGRNNEHIVAHADQALFQSKHKGRNQVSVYTPERQPVAIP